MTRRGFALARTGFLVAATVLAAGGACLGDSGSDDGATGGAGGNGGTSTGGASATGGASGAGSGGASSGGASSGGASSGGASSGGASGTAGTGGTSATGGASGAGGGSELANFATAREIVTVTCGGSDCHQPGGTPPALLVDDAKFYSTLMTFVSNKCGGRVLVKPGVPQESAFYLAQSGQCGDSLPRMPLGCVDRCTPPEYLEGLRQWIVNGAPRE